MADLTAQMVLTADATGVEAGVGRAKRSLKDLGATAATEGKKASDGLAGMGEGSNKSATKIEASTKNIIGSIQRTTAALESGKKGSSAYYESIGKQRGISADALKPYLDQLKAVEAQTRRNTAAAVDFSKVTTSLGARNTISGATTSLGATSFTTPSAASAASGIAGVAGAVASIKSNEIKEAAGAMEHFGFQTAAAKRELLVLAHELSQGNYKRFGGSLLVLGEQTGAASLLFSKAGIASLSLIGILAAVGVALYKGSNEASEYAKAIVLTGNYLGKTTDQLAEMARQVSLTTGTTHQAAVAIAELAQSGKIAEGAMQSVSAAVVSMARVLGTSVADSITIFEKLGDEPTKASAKLNESLHYLNLTTYERIRALEEQGNKEAASALAQKTLADETVRRLAIVELQAGSLTRGWKYLAHGASEAWDAMLGIGRPQLLGERLGQAQQKLIEAQAQAARNPYYAALYAPQIEKQKQDIANISELSRLAQRSATEQGEKAQTNAAQIGASDRIKILTNETKTNSDKRKKAIEELNRDYKTLDKDAKGAEYDKLVDNINQKYKDPKVAKAPAFQDDAGTKMLEQLKEAEASLKIQLAGETKITEAQKEQAKFLQLIADLKGKTILTAAQKSLLADQEAIKIQLAKNVALSNQVEYEKEIERIVKKSTEEAKEFGRQITATNISIESANQSRRDQYDRTLSTVGLGDRARREIEAEKSIRKEYENYKRNLTKDAAEKNQLDSDEYKAEIEKISGSLTEALANQVNSFAKEKEARENWLNGAKAAFANYTDDASNAALHTQEAFTNALKGIEDQFVNLFSGKKVDFKKLLGDIQGDLTRNFVKENITGPLAKLGGDAIGDGGILSGLLGSKKLGGDRGSSASNPLFVQMASMLGLGGSSSGGLLGGGSSGGGLTGLLGSFAGSFGGTAAQAGIANALPGDSLDNLFRLTSNFAGRASGGSVTAGGMYNVNEKGPELLNIGGKSLLMMGNKSGTVTPNSSIQASNSGVNVTNNFSFSEAPSRKTQDQVALAASNAINRARRNA